MFDGARRPPQGGTRNLVLAEPVEGVHTFGPYGGGVQLIFQMCPKRCTIRVSNQCD